MSKSFVLSPEAMGVIQRSSIANGSLYLPDEQLPRRLYVEVNKAIESNGGKWDKRSKSHLFPAGGLDDLIAQAKGGKVVVADPNPLDFFATPPSIAEEIVRLADLGSMPIGGKICEPSAGDGAILRVTDGWLHSHKLTSVRLEYYEIDAVRFAKNAGLSQGIGYCADWLSDAIVTTYDRILMNPPFNINNRPTAWADHILKAWERLAPNGILVSVAPFSVNFVSTTNVQKLRDLIDNHGVILPLPADSFKSAGTLVNTVLVKMQKPSR